MAEKKRELFQQKALDRLQSPDELDKLYSVTNPVGWVGLLTVMFLIVSGIVWAFFGVMADKVSGTGLIKNVVFETSYDTDKTLFACCINRITVKQHCVALVR